MSRSSIAALGAFALGCGQVLGVAAHSVTFTGLEPYSFYFPTDPFGFDPNASETSTIGFALSGGLPPDQFHLEATQAETHQYFGSYDVLIRPDTITLLVGNPTPKTRP